MAALLNIRIIFTSWWIFGFVFFIYFYPEHNEGSVVLSAHFSFLWKLMQLLDK